MAFTGKTPERIGAAKVKIADVEDNVDALRLSSLDEWDFARIKKYHTAWRLLQEELK